MSVDPFSFSSFGSINSNKPGSLKETAELETLVVNTSGAIGAKMPLWSGTAGDDPNYDHLDGIPIGKKLLVFGFTLASAQYNATVDGQVAALTVSGHSVDRSGNPITGSEYTTSSFVWSAKGTGPLTLSLELPLQFNGPCNVWADQIINTGGASVTALGKYNYSTFNYLIVDADNLSNT